MSKFVADIVVADPARLVALIDAHHALIAARLVAYLRSLGLRNVNAVEDEVVAETMARLLGVIRRRRGLHTDMVTEREERLARRIAPHLPTADARALAALLRVGFVIARREGWRQSGQLVRSAPLLDFHLTSPALCRVDMRVDEDEAETRLWARLVYALQPLSVEERICYILSDHHDQSRAEVGEAVGLSVDQVKARLETARTKVRERIAEILAREGR